MKNTLQQEKEEFHALGALLVLGVPPARARGKPMGAGEV